jgi:DNA primase
MTDFTMQNVPQRLRKLGDLWKPLLSERERVSLDRFL